MKKVLVIAYYFPPLGLSGVQRTLKFVKYLREFGWQPTVLTVGETGYYAKDSTLLREIDSSIEVIRTKSHDINSLFKSKDTVSLPRENIRKFMSRISDMIFIPDSKIGWKKHALHSADELFRREKFDVVFATAPPQTALLIAADLKKKYGIPMVLDYRDSWVDYPFKTFPTPLHKLRHLHLETSVLRSADAIVTASANIRRLMINRYDFLDEEKVVLIPQGFDEEDMNMEVHPRHDDVMRFTYSGLFYEDRTPHYFLEALHNVLERKPMLREKIEAHFLGTFRPEHLKSVERFGLSDRVHIHGYLSHKECVKFLLESDVLWVMMNDDQSTPGKIFEYIGTRKKILGCVPNGTMREIIYEANGTCTDPDNVSEIERAIEYLFGQFLRRELRGASAEVAKRYNRKYLTGQLAEILSAVAK
jgi:glycosyltransferase involved in cell wall biosynthesis